MPEVLTDKSNFKAVMDMGESITESLIAANRAAAERERLEREVVEQARKWRAERVRIFSTTYDAVARIKLLALADNALAALVDALLDFESQREK